MSSVSFPSHLDELRKRISGSVHVPDDPSFHDLSRVYNGNVKTAARAVVCPNDAQDISNVVRFSKKHGLTVSVKSGGYSTAGWAINGDIIIDLHRIRGVNVEVPREGDRGYTSIRHMDGLSTSQDQRPSGSATTSAKRRRDDDESLQHYGTASRAVQAFLSSGKSAKNAGPREDGPPSGIRRRVDNDGSGSDGEGLECGAAQEVEVLLDVDMPDDSADRRMPSATPSNEGSGTSDGASYHSPRMESSRGSSTTSSTPHPADSFLGGASIISTLTFPPTSDSVTPSVRSAANADPFGYIDTPPVHEQSSDINPALPPSQALQYVSAVEPLHPHVYVTFGSGMRQKEVDMYTASHPVEARSLTGARTTSPYHVPFAAHPAGTGVMLHAGFGFQSRLRGLSVDNIVEVEMVLADGRIVIVSKDENPDLWWALRGAGATFGIVTRYKTMAYPIPMVFAGNLIYRFHRATAPSLMKHFRDCVKGAPRELYANLLLTAGPAGKDSLVVIQMSYIGNKDRGQEFLAALSSWTGEPCLLNEVDEKSFLHQQDSVAQVLRGKPGNQWFIRSALISSLSDEVVNKTVMQFANTPVGCTWLFELAGGAVADFENNCIPKSQREATFTVAALHQWAMGVNDKRCVISAEDWIYKTLEPVSIGGPFPSFLGRSESPQRVMDCYGSNWERLRTLKQTYDPDNFFRNTFWPLSASGEAVEPQSHEPASA